VGFLARYTLRSIALAILFSATSATPHVSTCLTAPVPLVSVPSSVTQRLSLTTGPCSHQQSHIYHGSFFHLINGLYQGPATVQAQTIQVVTSGTMLPNWLTIYHWSIRRPLWRPKTWAISATVVVEIIAKAQLRQTRYW